MTAILALLLDAYRELNAKRMFWIALICSGIVVAAFGAVGLSPNGVTVFGWLTPWSFGTNLFTPASFYKLIFVGLGVTLWISWAAMILALISTAGMFPDFLASGAVDLYLARPITRLRLFAVKFACGLLFVALQSGIFSLASFLVIGLRGGVWEPGLFLTVPLSVLFFSYLFAMCALIGVMTRSTIAALLLTLIFWMAVAAVHTTETALRQVAISSQFQSDRLDRQIAQIQEQLDAPPPVAPPVVVATPATLPANDPPATTQPAGSFIQGLTRALTFVLPAPQRNDREALENRLHALEQQRTDSADSAATFEHADHIARMIEAPLPKTRATMDLLEQKLVAAANLPDLSGADDAPANSQAAFRARRQVNRAANAEIDIQNRQESTAWIIGSSLAFEAVILGLAAWMFCRRDY